MAATDPPTNRYLTGHFAPVPVEVTAYDLAVDGAIPPALEGRYIRTGPNPIDPDPANHHWFVGDGMVHGVDLHGGRARWYRNRWITSPEVAAYKGIDPVPVAEAGLFPGSGNTNVIHHAGRIWAINELTSPYEITPELETVRQHNWGGPLPAGMTAHPKFDPATGEMHVMAYSFVEPYLRYHVVDAAGSLTRTEELALGGPVMVHDMGLTETRVIVFDLPVVFDLDAAMAGRRLPYLWDDAYQARVGVMPRAGSGADTIWIDVDPCYVFHPLNAYDDGDTVVIDLVRYETMFRSDTDGPSDVTGTFDRWTIDVAGAKVISERIDDRPQEFPRGDERLASRRHRFGFVAGTSVLGLGGLDDRRAAILKHDLVERTTSTYEFGAGQIPSEFVFVPASQSAGEDEGWLLGYVYDSATDTSSLVILDAHDLGDPVATVHLPVRVPQGFHGNWIPDRALTG